MVAKKRLSELEKYEKAVIDEIKINGSIRRRLQDLGLIEGTRVECVLKKKKTGIAAFNIRGAVIALRRTDTDLIVISPCEREW